MQRCIIIGSGLGGLSTGLILAREGMDVTILEQQSQPGGCLQCFTRNGVKFETGMHFIGSARPGQTLHRLLRFLDIADLPLSPLDPDAYDIVRLPLHQAPFARQASLIASASMPHCEFRFPTGYDALSARLTATFPHEADGIRRYIAALKTVAASSYLHASPPAVSVRGGFPASTAPLPATSPSPYHLQSINAVIDTLIADPVLRDILVGNLPLYAARRDCTPFSTHAFIADFYNHSAFRVTGGSDAIGHALIRELHRHNANVLTRARVTRILDNGTRVTGVTTADGRHFPADIVVSAIHPVPTLAMTNTPLIRRAFRERMAALPNTIGIFSVYLAFKPGTMPYLSSNFYSYTTSPWVSDAYTAADWPRGYLYMHHAHEASPTHARAGVILSYMHFDEVARWQGTRVGHRGDDYEAFKRDRAQRLISAVERDHPGLRDCIEAYYTSTPLTYLDYTGTPCGSAYGLARDVTLTTASHVPQRTKLPGLYLTGQNINSHGILGVLVGSIVTTSDILGTQYVNSRIQQSNT